LIPRFDERALTDGETRAALVRACADVGAFELQLTVAAVARLRATMAWARAFFALPAAHKRALDIAHSPHHRGYSEMHNERDWREQLHLGTEPPRPSPSPGGARKGERPPALTANAEWARLTGPNQWPATLGAPFAAALLAHQDEMAALGQQLLVALGLPGFVGDAYLVTKLINYLPQPEAQPEAQSAARSGVAAHVDYSLVTLLAQDDVGGLELQTRDGVWRMVQPQPDTLVVNLGELAEAASGGFLRATPHRVTNAARDRSRLSIPVFVNPPLDAVVVVPDDNSGAVTPPRPADVPHIHRVLPDGAPASFHYGAAEWRRKGRNVWCHHCAYPRDRAP
jgi:isopenicillin N synthase-like dioxygenase